MSRHKALIIGHRIVAAGRLRRCHHDAKHTIPKGAFCLEVREGMGWKGYCASCATEMVNQAQVRLTELQTDVPSVDDNGQGRSEGRRKAIRRAELSSEA